MAEKIYNKKERQKQLLEKLNTDPFLTDEDLAAIFNVSIPTIRLDRIKLGIPELRERIRNVASKTHSKVKSLHSKEIVGELLDINLNENGIAVLDTDNTMVFEKSKIVRGQFIYSFAESLAIAVIDADVALVGVANIKYKTPVYSGARLLAKADVKRIKGDSHIVWVKIMDKQVEIFRGKFILVELENFNS